MDKDNGEVVDLDAIDVDEVTTAVESLVVDDKLGKEEAAVEVELKETEVVDAEPVEEVAAVAESMSSVCAKSKEVEVAFAVESMASTVVKMDDNPFTIFPEEVS